jgi:hypothetical protein
MNVRFIQQELLKFPKKLLTTLLVSGQYCEMNVQDADEYWAQMCGVAHSLIDRKRKSPAKIL